MDSTTAPSPSRIAIRPHTEPSNDTEALTTTLNSFSFSESTTTAPPNSHAYHHSRSTSLNDSIYCPSGIPIRRTHENIVNEELSELASVWEGSVDAREVNTTARTLDSSASPSHARSSSWTAFDPSSGTSPSSPPFTSTTGLGTAVGGGSGGGGTLGGLSLLLRRTSLSSAHVSSPPSHKTTSELSSSSIETDASDYMIPTPSSSPGSVLISGGAGAFSTAKGRRGSTSGSGGVGGRHVLFEEPEDDAVGGLYHLPQPVAGSPPARGHTRHASLTGLGGGLSGGSAGTLSPTSALFANGARWGWPQSSSANVGSTATVTPSSSAPSFLLGTSPPSITNSNNNTSSALAIAASSSLSTRRTSTSASMIPPSSSTSTSALPIPTTSTSTFGMMAPISRVTSGPNFMAQGAGERGAAAGGGVAEGFGLLRRLSISAGFGANGNGSGRPKPPTPPSTAALPLPVPLPAPTPIAPADKNSLLQPTPQSTQTAGRRKSAAGSIKRRISPMGERMLRGGLDH